MAIKYVVIPSKRKVIGLLENTRYDAVNKISKMTKDVRGFCFWDEGRYVMPNKFKSEAVAAATDDFDPEVGKAIVKERLMKKYYNSLDKRVDKFYEDVIALNSKIFKTTTDVLRPEE